jgi:hypothetical protein
MFSELYEVSILVILYAENIVKVPEFMFLRVTAVNRLVDDVLVFANCAYRQLPGE